MQLVSIQTIIWSPEITISVDKRPRNAEKENFGQYCCLYLWIISTNPIALLNIGSGIQRTRIFIGKPTFL